MVNLAAILALADAHFTLHLLGPDEADVSPETGEESTKPLPENLVEDFVDEAADMIEEIAGLYSSEKGWERAVMFGFTDGVLAVADDSWSTLEDSYYEDAANEAYAQADETIDAIVQEFDGSRPWDEAAKGYIRSAIVRSDGDPSESGNFPWTAAAHAFVYGAEAAYEYEWKIIVTPAGNLLLTDEDSIDEAAMAQLESGKGSLLDRIFNAIGIDPDELAAAIGEIDGNDDDDDDDKDSEESHQ